MSSSREDLPRWRQRREPTEQDRIILQRNARIPKRYLWADLLTDSPEIGFEQESSYYLYGPSGVGKTHILCAMVRERALSRFDRRDCLFVSVDDLLSELKSRYNNTGRMLISQEEYSEESRADAYTTQLKEAEILALDDLGAERATEWAIGELYSIINHRYNEMKITYISSNLDLQQLSDMGYQRIASRIGHMCEVISVSGKNRRIGG